MSTATVNPEDEQQTMEAVADALRAEGISAQSQDTGGGILCVVIDRQDGGTLSWGLANETWGASIENEEGEHVGEVETDCPAETRSLATIVKAIKAPSIANGALLSPA
jgi:hypothetical protein